MTFTLHLASPAVTEAPKILLREAKSQIPLLLRKASRASSGSKSSDPGEIREWRQVACGEQRGRGRLLVENIGVEAGCLSLLLNFWDDRRKPPVLTNLDHNNLQP